MTDRPNVVWIFGDQHRAQALGCMGDANVHTPYIDALAADGVTSLAPFPAVRSAVPTVDRCCRDAIHIALFRVIRCSFHRSY